MIDLLTEYGPTLAYFILLLGACVEGETIVLSASFLAYTGFLSLPTVMLVAFCGTLFADQGLFFIGRHYGPALLERHPKLKEKSQRIFDLLHKHNVLFILSFRFIYGIRTASPLVIGTAGVPVRRFLILNLIAAVIWTVISCVGGYLLGYFFADDIQEMLIKVKHMHKYLFLGLGGVIALVAALIFLRKWARRRKYKTGDHNADSTNSHDGRTR